MLKCFICTFLEIGLCSTNQIIELYEHPSRPNKKGGRGVVNTHPILFLEEIFEHMQLFGRLNLLVSKMIFFKINVLGVVIRQNRISKNLSLYNVFIFAWELHSVWIQCCALFKCCLGFILYPKSCEGNRLKIRCCVPYRGNDLCLHCIVQWGMPLMR